MHSNPYKLPYPSCSANPTHKGEMCNFVCLKKQCAQHSLICSLCREDMHKGHPTKPLKFYLEELKQKYNEKGGMECSDQLFSLEQNKRLFLVKLQKQVEKIAETIRNLEEEIIGKFEKIKEEIIQELINGQIVNAVKFEIQQYLPRQKTQDGMNHSKIQQFGKSVCCLVHDLKISLLNGEQSSSKQKKDIAKLPFNLPSSITRKDNIFTQTNKFATENFCYCPIDVIKNFQNTKLKLKICRLKTKNTDSSIVVGVVQKTAFQKSLNKTVLSQKWTTDPKYFAYCNNATVRGSTFNWVKSFSENSVLYIQFKNNLMKISKGKTFADFKLPENQEYYLFFSLHGDTQVELACSEK